MSREKGFSMIELMIVCAVLIIIAVIAVPNIARANANYKLDASGHSVASLLQQARMQAVKTNQPAYVKYDGTGMVYITSNPGGAYAAGNPDVALSKGLSFDPAAPVTHTQLDTYVGGAGVWQIPVSIGFNARGLPCVPDAANPALCPSFPPA